MDSNDIPHRAWIALGANLGGREAALNGALDALRITPGIASVRASSFYDTAPVGGPQGQPRFLNAAAELTVTLSPHELLAALQHIEALHGRLRTAERNAPRTLDLDLLLYEYGENGGACVLRPPGLELPHPRLHERRFVLDPLCELAPALLHPVLKRTLQELRAALPAG